MVSEGDRREGHLDQSEEEEDLLRRSKKRNKVGVKDIDATMEEKNGSGEARKTSYKEAAMGMKGKIPLEKMTEEEDENVSDDDVIDKVNDEPSFWIGMTREEKWEAQCPWWNSLIVKLMGWSIGYHYLWMRIQATWRTQTEPLLIDLGNDFYIIKLYGREEYNRAMSEGPCMIGNHYLHMQ